VSRRSRSRCIPSGRTRALRSLGGFWLVALLSLVATPVRAADRPAPPGPADEVECPPFESTPLGPRASVTDPGVEPSAAKRGKQAVVPLAAGGGTSQAHLGEALLAFPKQISGKAAADFELAPGARVASSYFSPILCSTVVRVVGPPGADVAALVRRTPKGVALVRNDVYRTAATELRPVGPPDPYRPLQWGLDREQVEAARPVTDGTGARVALLDSTPDVAHRDLAGVRIRLLDGKSAAAPAAHGSLLAGIVRGVEHNGFGIAGVAPGADLVAIPVCTPTGPGASDECSLADLLRGVDLAWDEKAQVVNLSLVGPANPLLERAMDRLDQLGVVLVAAAGNEGTDEPRYPAAYPSVIGVGAIDRSGAPYVHGNRGRAVEVLAPGVEIVSTVPGDGFSFGDGTSLAAAHVSAELALAIAASGDPLAARTAFFQVARENVGNDAAAPVPPICDVLARLQKPCPKP
jgi:subtilisin family serine protease